MSFTNVNTDIAPVPGVTTIATQQVSVNIDIADSAEKGSIAPNESQVLVPGTPQNLVTTSDSVFQCAKILTEKTAHLLPLSTFMTGLTCLKALSEIWAAAEKLPAEKLPNTTLYQVQSRELYRQDTVLADLNAYAAGEQISVHRTISYPSLRSHCHSLAQHYCPLDCLQLCESPVQDTLSHHRDDAYSRSHSAEAPVRDLGSYRCPRPVGPPPRNRSTKERVDSRAAPLEICASCSRELPSSRADYPLPHAQLYRGRGELDATRTKDYLFKPEAFTIWFAEDGEKTALGWFARRFERWGWDLERDYVLWFCSYLSFWCWRFSSHSAALLSTVADDASNFAALLEVAC
ncbi:hypothetical protein BDW02DRAFT_605777 [Decorospora gaudefroyi]|uniref:Uncharacterized protein n=1 Tax=Decorospora gaudefroyi TaxID=184978 RepID=A0A6A5K9N7_9PLEO|nr:hypothetical protein BDW02DRAFT_605777 [Decorospora gaudefroyi]